MTDEEALKEIDRQEKRFAVAKCGRGLQLAKSAREYYQAIARSVADRLIAKPDGPRTRPPSARRLLEEQQGRIRVAGIA